ncbi:MAG TPA: hypothetical protein VFL12_13410, partial [Thermoanaerobaculia bacterium]|nr:hypothetical protein [Thermoanaerobaculia bacterium]
MIRRLVLLAVFLAALPLRADFAAPPSADAEEAFARAAESLDRGDAEEARKAFEDLLAKYPLPAWKARVDFFRARRALDRGSPSEAAAALAAVDARPIGMQGYRDWFLGLALEKAGRKADAREAFLRAASDETARADRVPAAIEASRVSTGKASRREALAALEAASPAASADQRRDMLDARSRLAAELGDDDALARAAAELVDADPALLFDRKLFPALLREARKRLASESDAGKLETAERLAAAGQTTPALQTAAEAGTASLSPAERRRLHLVRARAYARLGKLDSSDREARLVGEGAPEESAAALVVAENALRRALARRGRSHRVRHVDDLTPDSARQLATAFHAATVGDATDETRMRGFRSEVNLWAAAGDRGAALDAARRMTAIDAGAT